jgi:hypothetical protein
MPEKNRYEELVAEKVKAGLPRADAEEVAERQIEWDETDPHDPPPAKKKGAKPAKPEPAQ